MGITRMGGCDSVCAEVQERLRGAGLLSVQDVRHGPIFAALGASIILAKDEVVQLIGEIRSQEGPVSATVDRILRKWSQQVNLS